MQGNQRKFLFLILKKTDCPSIKELSNRFLGVSYSAWRNYFSEIRLLPLNLFEELCKFANVKKENFKFEELKNNWGQVVGGKKGKRRI